MKIFDRYKYQLAVKLGYTTASIPAINKKLKFHVSTRLEYNKVKDLDKEEKVLQCIMDKLKPDDIVYDVGGNIGLFAVPISSRLSAGGKIIIFEPVSCWADRLSENLSLNKVSNAEVYKVGLFSENKDTNMKFKQTIGSGMASVVADYDSAMATSPFLVTNVRLVTAKAFIKENNLVMPNIMKVDVEGAELEVLKGFGDALADKNLRMILIEMHPELMPCRPEKIDDYLKSHGFTLCLLGNRAREYHLMAERS